MATILITILQYVQLDHNILKYIGENKEIRKYKVTSGRSRL